MPRENINDLVLWPKLKSFVSDYPDINVEIVVDYGLTGIAAQRQPHYLPPCARSS